MLNHVVLIGRLGRDPELKYTPSGVAVATFSLAVNRQYKSQATGDYETDWFNIVAWRQRAEYAANYLSKGRLVAVEGKLQARSWVAQDGTKRNTVEVVAENVTGLDRPKDQTGAPTPSDDEIPTGQPAADIDSEYDPFAEE